MVKQYRQEGLYQEHSNSILSKNSASFTTKQRQNPVQQNRNLYSVCLGRFLNFCMANEDNL